MRGGWVPMRPRKLQQGGAENTGLRLLQGFKECIKCALVGKPQQRPHLHCCGLATTANLTHSSKPSTKRTHLCNALSDKGSRHHTAAPRGVQLNGSHAGLAQLPTVV